MREITKDHFSDECQPEFPLKDSGEVWYVGWDIPGYWAVDANGQGFADFGAHGICLKPCAIEKIIREVEAHEDEGAGARLRKLVGRKPPLPGWIRYALSTGWIAPASFSREDYE